LVNIDEEGISKDREKLEGIIEKEFRTATGKQLADNLFLDPADSN
jgi:hypothetical protein